MRRAVWCCVLLSEIIRDLSAQSLPILRRAFLKGKAPPYITQDPKPLNPKPPKATANPLFFQQALSSDPVSWQLHRLQQGKDPGRRVAHGISTLQPLKPKIPKPKSLQAVNPKLNAKPLKSLNPIGAPPTRGPLARLPEAWALRREAALLASRPSTRAWGLWGLGGLGWS